MYEGRPVAAGVECLKPSFSMLRLSTKASMNLTGFSLSMYLLMASGESTVWSLWVPFMCSLITASFEVSRFNFNGCIQRKR